MRILALDIERIFDERKASRPSRPRRLEGNDPEGSETDDCQAPRLFGARLPNHRGRGDRSIARHRAFLNLLRRRALLEARLGTRATPVLGSVAAMADYTPLLRRPTYFYVDGQEFWTYEEGVIPLAKGMGFVHGSGHRYRVVDLWFSIDHHGRFDDGLHVFLEKVDASDDRLKPWRPTTSWTGSRGGSTSQMRRGFIHERGPTIDGERSDSVGITQARGGSRASASSGPTGRLSHAAARPQTRRLSSAGAAFR